MENIKKCPRCKRTNNLNTEKCECGYKFSDHLSDAEKQTLYLANIDKNVNIITNIIIAIVVILILAIIIVLAIRGQINT